MTDTLVWDDAGARYYETGVSRGIFFPIQDGSLGVPWNGLVSVNMDPQGGEPESYWFDGVKYMDRVLGEDFQATIQAISTPREFESAEGIATLTGSFGGKTSFNRRDKFHMVWRTEIGNDQNPAVAYKIHIVYNCLVQPSARAYQTISDNTTPDIRSFIITATPACNRQAYFSFDSREGDLSLLEAQLNMGVLPKCWELAALTTSLDGSTPQIECPKFIVDFEKYSPGQTLTDEIFYGEVNTDQATINGVVNNGLDVTELPAEGAFAANDSAASEVGTHPVLVDDDDASYITSAQGDLGYTIGLPPLVGYVEGCTFELHIRMSISGDVSEDDPDNLDADAQVHISTDDTGDLTIGGFSDGADEGVGFSLTAVDGSIVDYVVPLSMDAWVDSTLADVVAALTTGAYLNVVGATNNNPNTTVEVRVYEASVLMLNDTEPAKALRGIDDETTDASVELHMTELVGIAYVDIAQDLTEFVDFKVFQVPYDSGADGFTQDLFDWRVISGTSPGALRLIPNGDGVPQLSWKADNGTTDLITYVDVERNKWYRAQADWSSGTMRIRVYDRDLTPSASILDHTETVVMDPVAFVKCWAGFVGSDGDSIVNHRIMIDNAEIHIDCTSVTPPTDGWTDIDLSSVDFKMTNVSHMDMGAYSGGKIVGNPDWTDSSATFSVPGLTLDPTKSYDFEFTWVSPDINNAYGIMQQNPAWATTFFSDNRELFYSFPSTTGVFVATVGPGIDDWDTAVTDGYQTLIRFDVSVGLTTLRYKEH